jgi:hypothetical protein
MVWFTVVCLCVLLVGDGVEHRLQRIVRSHEEIERNRGEIEGEIKSAKANIINGGGFPLNSRRVL